MAANFRSLVAALLGTTIDTYTDSMPLYRIASTAKILLALSACAEGDPAMRVGEVPFTEAQITGLTAEQRELLGDLAALGQLIADGEEDSLVGPLAEREAHRSRLTSLPYVLAVQAAGIGEDSLRAAYASAPEWELSVRHIVRLADERADESDRAAALDLARQAERRARAGEDFSALAAELSEEPGAADRGGLLAPGRRGSWVDPFWEAASVLEPGQVSPVIETEYGYHVLRLERREPVRFEEAARLPLLRRIISPAAAQAAMEAWAISRPPIIPDPPAVGAAREALLRGSAPDTLVIARSDAGDEYTARDLALTWAALEPSAREALENADETAFGTWLQDDMRERFWADEAERLGAEQVPGAIAAAEAEWRGAIGRMAAAAGYRRGMTGDEIADASLAALQARGQEALITRAELPGLRALLREIHPPTPRP